MKSIKCKSCGKVWIVDEKNINDLQVCPFCKTSILAEGLKGTGCNRIEDALCKVFSPDSDYNIKNSFDLCDALTELLPDVVQVQLIGRFLNDTHIKIIRDVLGNNNNSLAEKKVHELKRNLIDDEFLPEDWVEWLCAGILKSQKVCYINDNILYADVLDCSVDKGRISILPINSILNVNLKRNKGEEPCIILRV